MKSLIIIVLLTVSLPLVGQIDLSKYGGQMDSSKFAKVKIGLDSVKYLYGKNKADALIEIKSTVDRTSISLAHELANEAVRLYKESGNDSLAVFHEAVTAYYYMVHAQYDSAKTILDKTEQYYLTENDNVQLAETYIKKGWLLYEMSDYPSSLEQYYSAIAIFESIDINHRRLPDMYNRIGILYNTIGNHRAAYEVLAKALSRIESGEIEDRYEVLLQVNILTAMEKLGIEENYDLYQKKSAKRFLASSQPKSQMTGLMMEINRHLKLDNCDSASLLIDRLEQLSIPYEDQRFRIHWATLKFDMSQQCHPSKADLLYLKGALIFADSIKEADDYLDIYKRQEEFHNKYAQPVLAYEARQRYDSIQSTVLSEEKLHYITELQANEIQRKAKSNIDNLLQQNLEQSRKLRTQRIRTILLGLLSVLLLSIGTWIFLLYRSRNKYASQLLSSNQELEKSLENNQFLIKEIHHRVKNNLQVVSSLLNLQKRYEKDKAIIKAINTGKDRVHSISLLHKSLYSNEDLAHISIKEYCEELVEYLKETYSASSKNIVLQTNIQDFTLDIDNMVPLGLMINELITNCYKYAFEDRKEGLIQLNIFMENENIILEVIDNGVGVPFSEFPATSKSLGVQLINSFINKLEGDISLIPSQGTHLRINFPHPTPIINTKNIAV